MSLGSGWVRTGWVAALLTSACDDHLIGKAAPFGTGCNREPPLTYENFGEGILDRHCTTCHTTFKREGQRGGAPLDVNLNTWDEVLLWADRIEIRTIDEQTMPPTGTMVETERQQLEEWLRCEVFPATGEVVLEEEEEGA